MLVPFLFFLLSLASGIVVNHFLNVNIPIYIPVGIFIVSFFIKNNKAGFFVLNFAIFLLGFSLIFEKPISKMPNHPVFVECKVNSIPKNYFYGKSFDCSVKNSDFKELKNKEVKVYLKGNPFKTEIFYFSNLSFIGKLKFKKNKIIAYPKEDFIKIDNSKNPFILVYRLKKRLIENYKNNTLNEDSFQIGLPLIFGEKGFISQENREMFGKTGLSHLLAISGLHVGILIVSILFILFFVRQRIKQILILLILPFYAVFTGLQIPVLRASVMAGLYFFSKLKYLKINSLNILFFVGFLILLFSPNQLFSIGFQLSFIATLGIILGLDLINFKIKNLPKIINFLIQMFIVSFIATIFTLPLILYYFGGFSFISILATPIAILPLYPYLFLSVLNLITFMKLDFLVKFMDIFGILFLKIVNLFYGIEAYFQGFSPSIFLIFIYLVVISLILFLNFNVYKKIAALLISIFVFLFLSKTKHNDFKIYTFKSKILPVVLILTPERDGYLVGDYANFKLKTILKKENPLKLFLIYRKNEPYKIIESLNVDFEDYYRFEGQFKGKDFFIQNQKNKLILKIQNKEIILKNTNGVFKLQN